MERVRRNAESMTSLSHAKLRHRCRLALPPRNNSFHPRVLLQTKPMPGKREVRHADVILDDSAACDLGCVHASRVKARRTVIDETMD